MRYKLRIRILQLLLIFGWLLAILFPTAWLARKTRMTRYLFNYFTPEWVHVVGHSFIFAMLAILVLSLFQRNHWLIYAGTLLLVLCIGTLQEGIQMMAAGSWPGWGEVYDIIVDLFGALGGMSLVATKRLLSAIIWPVNRNVSHGHSR